MPETTITIDRRQREGLYELIRNHLGCVGDLWVALAETGDFAKAEQLGREFAEDFRLLEDIGWAEEERRERFELTMPPHDLMEALWRLQGEARRGPGRRGGQPRGRRDERVLPARPGGLRRGPRRDRPRGGRSSMSAITLTIGASERDALHRLMLHRLFVLGKEPIELARIEGVSIEQLGEEFGEDVRLMQDLGWLFESDSETVELTMPADELVPTLKRLRRDGGADSPARCASRCGHVRLHSGQITLTGADSERVFAA